MRWPLAKPEISVFRVGGDIVTHERTGWDYDPSLGAEPVQHLAHEFTADPLPPPRMVHFGVVNMNASVPFRIGCKPDGPDCVGQDIALAQRFMREGERHRRLHQSAKYTWGANARAAWLFTPIPTTLEH